MLLDEYLAGAVVVLMLAGGNALEQFAVAQATSVLRALASRVPTIAHRRLGAGFEDVPVDQVVVGDELSVLPHEICPVDGDVIQGHGSMDESYLTGEPFTISKGPARACCRARSTATRRWPSGRRASRPTRVTRASCA